MNAALQSAAAREPRSTAPAPSDLMIGWHLAAQHSRVRQTLGRSALALGLVVIAALLTRAARDTYPVYAALSGPAYGLALPVMVYLFVSQAMNGSSLTSAVNEPARLGSSRRRVGLGLGLRASLNCALLGAAMGAATVLAVRMGNSVEAELALLGDVAVTAGCGALGGAAYAQLLLLLSTFGGGERARLFGIAADWLLGSTTGVLAVPWPRSHLERLVGGLGPVEMSSAWSYASLWAIGVVCALLSWWRTPN